MGKPKGMLQVQGRPILTYLLQRFAWRGPKWVITAPGREDPPGAAEFDRELIDPQAGLGPLRGVLTALDMLETEFLIVTTVDMPLLERMHLEHLLERLQTGPQLLGMMYMNPSGPEPFALALRKSAVDSIRSRLDAGRRSVHGLLEEREFVAMPAPSDWGRQVWLNLNEPADVKMLRELSM